MLVLMIWILVCATVAALYLGRVYTTFSNRGVKQPRVFPILGNMGRVIFQREHFTDQIDGLYNKYPQEKFIGLYEFVNPVLLIRDIELVKKITIKDFEHFIDHRKIINAEIDPLFGRNLLFLKGQEWRDMRSSLSPAFTSSKIKSMVPFIVEVGEQVIKSLKKIIENSKAGYIDIDCKDLTTRYTNDVIATCAFGVKVDSLKDENNQFYEMGKTISTSNFKRLIVSFAYVSFPAIMNLLKVPLFTEEPKKFFTDLVMSTMRDRETRDSIRPDMIHLLMEAKKGNLSLDDDTDTPMKDVDDIFTIVEHPAIRKKTTERAWSDDDLIAQAILFFVAGFETVSTTVSFLLHELAVNPEVQNRLAQEIREHNVKSGGKLDYNSIQSMTYMDMVVSELLRLWTPAMALDRMCIKDYNMGKPNDEAKEDFIIRKGTCLLISMWSFHRNPKYFPNPLKFDPERFSAENKPKIQPFTYMPFGAGPRSCIGSRFALCEVKIMVYQLLLHMEVTPCEKTSIPLRLAKDTFKLKIEGGHWIRLKPRK